MYLISLVERELKLVDHLITNTLKRLSDYADVPDKTLVCRHTGLDSSRYYLQDHKDGKHEQKSAGDRSSPLVTRMLTLRFLNERLKVLQKDKRLLISFLNKYCDFTPEAIQRRLPASYRDLPEECYNDEIRAQLGAWASEQYERNPFPLPDDPNIARDGTPFRSKGECMWYDDILFEKIPVRIEPVLRLCGKSGQWHSLCPDFQFRCHDGSYLLVEHFGMWDTEKYAERNKMKIQEYLDCGFVLGDNLIVTSDNADHNTNELMIIEALEKIRKRVFGE